MRDWREEVRARLGPDANAHTVEEMAQHIADVHRAALFNGRSSEEADVLAYQEIAGLTPAAVRRRNANALAARDRGAGWVAGLAGDMRHAIRLVGARPGYATAVILTLAIGIGGCAAVYSLFNALLRTPLPFPDAERLVFVWEANAQDLAQHSNVAVPTYEDWRAGTTSFAALAIYRNASFNLAAAADPERVPGVRASASLFDVLSVPPALGRAFTPAEERSGAPVAVISDAVWKHHFGADRRVLGQTIRLNGAIYEVVGVMPVSFGFPSQRTAVWVPLIAATDEQRRDWHAFLVIGRLLPSVTFNQARDEVQRLGESLRHRYPDHEGHSATIERMSEVGLAGAERMIRVLGGAVALVLAIACVNVAGLQLASGLARRREFATRLALGARYGHLARQLLAESSVLAILGCLAGLLLTFLAIRSFDVFLPVGFRTVPFRGDVPIGLDGRVLGFASVTAFISAVMFALAPLRAARRETLQPVLRSGERGATQAATRARRALVAAEVALAILVLTAAGLVTRSLTLVLQQAPGLDSTNILALDVSVPQENPYGPADRQGFCADLRRETARLPGVMRVSAVDYLPLSPGNANRIFTSEDGVQPAAGELYSAEYRVVCPDYFKTLSIPMLHGRDFSDLDHRDGPPVLIINRAFADRYLPGKDTIGRRVKLGRADSANEWMTIIAVVESVRHFGLDAMPSPEMYVPYPQVASPSMTLVAKTANEPLAWEGAVREAVRRVDPSLPSAHPRSMEQVIADSTRWRETPMRLLSAFALVGLLLAAIGVYSVLAYYVSQRTREFGVRMALGASKAALVRLVLRQSALPVAIGVVLGSAWSLASGQLLAGMLYEVEPGDPVVLATIVGLLLMVTIASGWLPARRAASVDPLTALRDE